MLKFGEKQRSMKILTFTSFLLLFRGILHPFNSEKYHIKTSSMHKLNKISLIADILSKFIFDIVFSIRGYIMQIDVNFYLSNSLIYHDW